MGGFYGVDGGLDRCAVVAGAIRVNLKLVTREIDRLGIVETNRILRRGSQWQSQCRQQESSQNIHPQKLSHVTFLKPSSQQPDRQTVRLGYPLTVTALPNLQPVAG
jgi:hypothetical protein